MPKEQGEALCVANTGIAAGSGHPFYIRLNEMLDFAGVNAFRLEVI